MKVLIINYELPFIGGRAGQAHLAILRQYARNSGLQVDVPASKPDFVVQKLSENITSYTVGTRLFLPSKKCRKKVPDSFLDFSTGKKYGDFRLA